LAVAFQAGLDASLKLGADVIVNTDADGQYSPDDLPTLLAPILAGDADLVVGDRGVATVEDFSPRKRRLQKIGSRVVSAAAGTSIPDATSGYRAYNRDAALQLVVLSRFTYTLETLIQAGASPLTVQFVPITRHKVDRPSRLFTSNWNYIRRSIQAITQVSTFYRPLRVFTATAVGLAVLGLLAWVPFVAGAIGGSGHGHVQSVILGAVFMIAAVQVAALGVVADLLSKQRHLSQITLERVRRVELHLGVPPSHYEQADG
jgi:glycosyltransferase involved in cell wall biosynthesis